MSTPSGWEGILDEGEVILWQGRPGQGFHVGAGGFFGGIFGLFFAGFAVFWMVMASNAPGNFWMFGLIHFSVGLALSIGSIVGPTWKRRHSWYTLTDRRAFIATDMPFKGRTLKSYPIGPNTVIDYKQGDPASIHFAEEWKRGSKGGSYKVKIGFERLENGDEVMRQVRKAQEVDETMIREHT
ncbi:aspartate carbamoyltransferase catalytic subunit [Maritimibacter alexandrii]|uniref:aspartate carbamoyltransferase catalytic subunit n=1 Tax=Maritimibacter alexandrii TaxID=2570355 RepID=UPI001107BF51|nr:aspartate carbamoyltransferase catalytic subunit [Maritimibacter alexandrii]